LRITRIVVTTLFVLSVATVASAQATRTWVSGVGDDVNPCSRTAPCKTFAGAISKTAAGGEINAIDSGGFGTISITKSITIDGAGVHASILFSGVNGVIVNDQFTGSPNTIEVTLRNLSLNGAGSTLGVDGIRFLSGKRLSVENCTISNGSGDGIEVATTVGDLSLSVRNTTIENFGSTAMNIHPTMASGNFFVNITNSNVNDITSSSAVALNGAIRGHISNTQITRAPNGAGVSVLGGADVSLDHVRSYSNQFGLLVSGANSSVVRLKDCLMQGTSNSVQNNTAGNTVTAFQSNVLVGTATGVTSIAPQ
jgi:hypothetical protein